MLVCLWCIPLDFLFGGLEPGRVTELLQPFANLLADRQISGYLFDSILREIFLTILHDYADQKAAAAEASNADEGDEDDGMDGDETQGMEQEEEESGAASDSSRIK
ncbi:unnamed protein product, partial [Anisakis simplex]|uniref:Importin-7 n=1 Tax=Anisakis simplex TaxID=6269 RepID=A0A0M3JNG8_ANISI